MSTAVLPAGICPERLVRQNLDVEYPVVTGLADAAVMTRINNIILENVYALIRQQGYCENPMVEITGYFELKTNERNVLSLTLGNYGFSGGAHGLTLLKGLTFDLQTGYPAELADLFKPGADYVSCLSALVDAQIKARDIPLFNEFTGIRPDQDFYLADKALVLFFQLYEITPYVFGFPIFPISVYELQEIIAENGLLGRMATND
ncbi:MAG TPA: DUF3298 and DUF4163 domain-containing protein [Bacillota bacterium]|jgi:hypothetical protein|nr:DUF3298 and DUF4163 domain-containing protein [Bacillota bacterium]HPT68463.1 DUF3298 and DUF4163 domain-containing protein [Bacillota bacterium]